MRDPTRTKRTKWSFYQWSEAHSLAVHFLELALLAHVGYRGRYHPRIVANRWLGYTEDVPWTGCKGIRQSEGVLPRSNPGTASRVTNRVGCFGCTPTATAATCTGRPASEPRNCCPASWKTASAPSCSPPITGPRCSGSTPRSSRRCARRQRRARPAVTQRCRQRQARRSVQPYLTQLRTPPKADFS